MKKILIVVDPQNDFVKPNGALAVPNAETVIPNINKLLNAKFDFVIISQDWHPADHISFARTHGAEVFTERDTLQGAGSAAGIKTIRQVMWPNHCVANTSGAEIHSGIDQSKVNAIFRKGADKFRECYSLFEYVYEPGTTVFGDEYLTPFYKIIAEMKPIEIIICGYATDFCCAQTAIGANKIACATLITDACAPVDPGNVEMTYKRLQAINITLKTTAKYLGE